jgi:hypothetical protein
MLSKLEINEETAMKSTLIASATLVAAAYSTPALAQAVIDNPGMCAQLYPNANCEDLGPGNPYTDGGYYRNGWQNGKAFSGAQWRRYHAVRNR